MGLHVDPAWIRYLKLGAENVKAAGRGDITEEILLGLVITWL